MTVSLEDLGRAVKQLQYRHHRGMDQRLRQAGTSLAQWDALRAVSRRPNSSAHALAELTFQTDQSFGALAGRLVRAGLIERKAGRGRAIWHQLTPKGQSVLKKGYEVIGGVLEASFGPLSVRRREELYRFLKLALEEGEPAQRVGF
ncbi:MAG TPA: MarR family transcriptional regulator [Candidatus Dormibacteraeota bacterium]|nr:MarR family transcriptional regulator [Candidatus Dormibacteraeota bacterium]